MKWNMNLRINAPEAIILVGTPNFCTSLEGAIKSPLNYDNVMYTYHFYADLANCDLALGEIQRGLENGVPIFISEWGLDSYNATKEMWDDTEKFLRFLDEKKIGWINWSLCNKAEGYSVVKEDVLSLSQWDENDFSDIGQYVIEQLSR